jgi:Tol biopolymer transport system component
LSGDLISGEDQMIQLNKHEIASRPSSITFSVPGFLSRQRLPWIFAAMLALAAAFFAYKYFSDSTKSEMQAIRLSFEPPQGTSFNDVQPDSAVISPDGRRIAFSATVDGKNMLYVQELNSSEAKLLPGSDNPLEPFWSPDSKTVAYGSNGKLKRSDIAGGNAQVLCDAARMVGGSWNKDGTIIFVPNYRTALVQVSAKGGEPQPVAVNVGEGESRHRYPYFLPDGRRFLFLIEEQGLWAGSLDSPEVKQIAADRSPGVFSKAGHLIFVQNDTMVAQSFDPATLELSGEPMPVIADQISSRNNFRFSVSDTGVLILQDVWEREYQLTWFDRDGKPVGTVEAPAKVMVGQDPHISPDGKRVAIKRNPPQTLWAADLEKSTSIRITSDFGQMPVWSPDGSRVAYSGNGGILAKSSSGLGEPEVVLPSATSGGAAFPYCWSPDGRYIIYLKRGVKTRLDIYAVALGDGKEIPLLDSPFDERSPALSPDGKWLAYYADDTGSLEVYVQSFSAAPKLGSDRKRISTTGGRMPVWSRDGSELFFIAGDGQLMSSPIKAGGGTFEFGAPKALFKTRMLADIGSSHEFDVSPDGQRFLIGTLIGDSKAPPPTVILNWTALLKK